MKEEVIDIKEFKKDLSILLKKYNVELDMTMKGDTHGIFEEAIIVSSRSDRSEHCICNHTGSVSHISLLEDLNE